MIALLTAFFTILGALTTLLACCGVIALVLDARRVSRQHTAPAVYPPLRLVRDDLAERRAMRANGGRVA